MNVLAIDQARELGLEVGDIEAVIANVGVGKGNFPKPWIRERAIARRMSDPQAWWDERTIPEPNTGCVLWTGAANHGGYGTLSFAGSHWLAHRLSWSDVHGNPSPGLEVCHKCDTPACVNIDHLFLGTHAENMRDYAVKERTGAALSSSGVVDVVGRFFGGEPVAKIAEVYGVSHGVVRNAVRGRTWSHLPIERERAAEALRLRQGLSGERNNGARLTEAQVLEIRAAGYTETAVKLASRFGVSRNTIQNIRNGRSWL